MASNGAQRPVPAQGPFVTQLMAFCANNRIRMPVFQQVSDRRGSRTAWGIMVNVNGSNYGPRLYYARIDGDHAKEDTAQHALQMLGVLPRPNLPPQQAQPPQAHGGYRFVRS